MDKSKRDRKSAPKAKAKARRAPKKEQRRIKARKSTPRRAKPHAVKARTAPKPKRAASPKRAPAKRAPVKARAAKRVVRPKMGRKKHPDHLRTETIGFALYPADVKTLMAGCAKRGNISKSSAFRLAIRLWAKSGFPMDPQAFADKARGNKDPIRIAKELAAKKRTAKRRPAKAARRTRRSSPPKAPKAPHAPKAPRGPKAPVPAPTVDPQHLAPDMAPQQQQLLPE